MRTEKIELLAPAGNYESFLAAINAGADAVYLGGDKYSARAYANNFTEEELLRAIDYAHLYEKKVYLTVNTLLKENELAGLKDYLRPYYLAGLDAIIVQDIGAIDTIKFYFPDLSIHASTQMTITASEGVQFLQKIGIKRVVLARELSLQEITMIHENNPDIEIECFIHGALCYCYSGKCLFSSLIGGRSGNRGRCAQPCRLPYTVMKGADKISDTKESYPLSTKDIATLELLPKLINAGISSFKIEGRMKRPEYVAGVTSVYRKYIDSILERPTDEYSVKKEDYKELISLYTRSGSSRGYFEQKNGRDMITLEKPSYETGNEEIFKSIYTQFVETSKKLSVTASINLQAGMPAKLTLVYNGQEIETYGQTVELAQNKPLSQEDIFKQINKTGNTPFIFEMIDVFTDNHIFMPIKALNDLRREAIKQLEEKILLKYRREYNEPYSLQDKAINIELHANNHIKKPQLNVSVESKAVFDSLVKIEAVNSLYIPCWDREIMQSALKLGQEHHKNIYISLPVICRAHTMKHLRELEDIIINNNVLIHNYESLQWLSEIPFHQEIIADFDLYVFNEKSLHVLHNMGCIKQTASVELNEKELWKFPRETMEMVVYGYLPMMVSAQCVQNTFGGCIKSDLGEPKQIWSLKDRYGKKLQIRSNCKECHTIIYNSVPLSLHNEIDKLASMGFDSLRLMFTTETVAEATAITKEYCDRIAFGTNNRKKEFLIAEYTKGHFARGVE